MNSLKTKIIIAELYKNFKTLSILLDSLKRMVTNLKSGPYANNIVDYFAMNEQITNSISTLFINLSNQNLISYKNTCENNFSKATSLSNNISFNQIISFNLLDNVIYFSPNDFVLVVFNNNYFKGVVNSFDKINNILIIDKIYFIKSDESVKDNQTYKIFPDYSYIYNFNIPYTGFDIPIMKFNLSYFIKSDYQIFNDNPILDKDNLFNRDIYNSFDNIFLSGLIVEMEENILIIKNMYNFFNKTL